MGISTYPASTGSSRLVTKQNTAGQDILNGTGTSVTMGNGSYGSWTQLVASLGSEMYLTSISAWRTAGGYSTSFPVPFFQIGIGGAGSETAIATIVGDLMLYPGDPTIVVTYNLAIPLRVASGQRVSGRGNASVAGSTWNLAIFGQAYANVDGN